MKLGFHPLWLALAAGLALGVGVPAQSQEKQDIDKAIQQEEQEDYYRKWLKQDVVYIIAPEEKQIFESLTTDEEKDQFIEQFWFRRDTDRRDTLNEFKEEHYRRIAYVNERFGSGLPGWRTDRGKTYIIHGPPDQIEPHRSGGSYDRPSWEGGGTTSTFPFEIWTYRHIKDLGSDIVLEFVDRSYSGEYKLALEPEEKDAFLYVPNQGLTRAEQMGLATKAQRPFFDPSNRDYPMYQRRRDMPFERWSLWNRIHHIPQIKYTDLQEIVKVDLSYQELDFKTRLDYFRLNENQVLVPITVEVQNKDLTSSDEGGRKVARVAVYGIVTSLSREIVTEFDDDLMHVRTEQELNAVLQSPSRYQKTVVLDRGQRYKLSLVVKDLNSENIGVVSQVIIPPKYEEETLAASSVMLSNSYQLLETVPEGDQMFVLGDVWIHPSLNKTFTTKKPLGVYFQVYNAGFDQSAMTPVMQLKYELFRDGKTVMRIVEHNSESVQFVSERRVVFLKTLRPDKLGPGSYRLKIEVTDRTKEQSLTIQDRFKIAGEQSAETALLRR